MPNQVLNVGSLTAAPGEKRYGVNEFTVDGRPYKLPMWLVNGSAEGPTLVVTGGVHAAEYASIAAALDLGRATEPSTNLLRARNARVADLAREIAKVFGIRYLVCSETPGSTFSAASRKGIPSILAEAGGQGIWTPEDVGLLTNGLDRVMRHLRMIP